MLIGYEDVLRTALALRGYRLTGTHVGRHVFWPDLRVVTLCYEDGQGRPCSGGDLFDREDLEDGEYLTTWVDAYFPDLLNASTLLAQAHAAHQARLLEGAYR